MVWKSTIENFSFNISLENAGNLQLANTIFSICRVSVQEIYRHCRKSLYFPRIFKM